MVDWLLVGVAGNLALLLAIFAYVWRRLRGAMAARLDEATLGAFVTASLKHSGIQQDLGEVKRIASDMAQSTRELQRVFQVQQQRGLLGELQLEAILADVVPRDRLLIRKNHPLLGTPDAAIRIRDGVVCIDSKFPLDQYRELVGAPETEHPARSKAFLRTVRSHFDTIASKYVRPDAGSAPYAVAFIPSEAVYTFLHQADPGLAHEYARRGVLLASPSTLTSHVALIVMGLQAEVLTERVQVVQQALQRIDREFGRLREVWDVLRRHVKNTHEQSQRVEQALDALDAAYRSARSLEVKSEEARAPPPLG